MLVDKTVADAFIAAIQPAQLQLSINTIERFEADMKRINRQWDLRIEKAHYESDLARRRFTAVDPENRLVASNLERDWNEKLAEVDCLKREKESAKNPALRTLSSSERQSILNLASDLRKVWNAETTTQIERKQLLRYLIKDVTVIRVGKTAHINIRWQTEAFTHFNVTLYSPNPRKTDSTIIDIIRELAPDHTDQQIADNLNKSGLKTKHGLVFTKHHISNIRYDHDMPYLLRARPVKAPLEDGRCSVRAAARLLGVCTYTINRWCISGRLDAIRSKPGACWRINLTPEKIAELKQS